MLGFSGKRKYSDWECSGCKHPFVSEQWLKRHEKKCKAVREQAERAFQLGEENENRQKRRRVTEAEKVSSSADIYRVHSVTLMNVWLGESNC